MQDEQKYCDEKEFYSEWERFFHKVSFDCLCLKPSFCYSDLWMLGLLRVSLEGELKMQVKLWKYMLNRGNHLRSLLYKYSTSSSCRFSNSFVFHSKVLWPSMDKWVKKRKGHETAQSIPDSVIALTLRLIGK